MGRKRDISWNFPKFWCPRCKVMVRVTLSNRNSVVEVTCGGCEEAMELRDRGLLGLSEGDERQANAERIADAERVRHA